MSGVLPMSALHWTEPSVGSSDCTAFSPACMSGRLNPSATAISVSDAAGLRRHLHPVSAQVLVRLPLEEETLRIAPEVAPIFAATSGTGYLARQRSNCPLIPAVPPTIVVVRPSLPTRAWHANCAQKAWQESKYFLCPNPPAILTILKCAGYWLAIQLPIHAS